MGWGMPEKSMAIWMPTSMLVSLRMSSRKAFNIGAKLLRWSSSRIMTLNTLVKRLKPGWQTMDLMSWCGLLKRKHAEYQEPPASIQELWTRVQKEWDDIGEQECRNLIELMPRRVEAVLKAKGGHTKY